MPNAVTPRREAATFGAYFGSPQLPTEILERYELALGPPHGDEGGGDRFDTWLLRLAARRPALTALADAYARFARPYGTLRRRLTLMLALLETHGATHTAYTRARASSATGAWIALAASAAGWGVRTVLAALVCGPPHLVMSLMARPRA